MESSSNIQSDPLYEYFTYQYHRFLDEIIPALFQSTPITFKENTSNIRHKLTLDDICNIPIMINSKYCVQKID